MMDYTQALHKTYAGWLGKLVGIRLGAPVEMWTSQQILAKYGQKPGYLHDYREFAADDDSNGPTFFIRALEDSGRFAHISPQDVAQAWLNYASWGQGMYWWGGYGISAEHTAYENLRAGIPAPDSGSARVNGTQLSEQIGGQIFIDPWGMVCPGNPKEASRLAGLAASVSHDGEAVIGGQFVAACIAAAYTAQGVEEMLQAGLSHIPPESAYARTVRAVYAFCRKCPGDWKQGLAYIEANYWKDKFGGNCHIIPNAAIMVAALAYGQGSFDRTLEIANFMGFDTDCNVGNLGAMMGVLVGLEGIDAHKWLDVLHDTYVCSSCLGSLNLQHVPDFVRLLMQAAAVMGHVEPPADMAAWHSGQGPTIAFDLPGSTCGVRVDGDSALEALTWAHKALTLTCGAGEARAFVYTYRLPHEFDDDRYSPAFCPQLYPGQTLEALLAGQGGEARLYVQDCDGTLYTSPWQPLAGQTRLAFTLPPATNPCFWRAGVAIKSPKPQAVTLYHLDFKGVPDFTLALGESQTEYWPGLHREVRGFSRLKGYWHIDGGLMGSAWDLGEAYTGHVAFRDYTVSAEIEPRYGQSHRLLFRVQGGQRSYAVGIEKGEVTLAKNAGGYTVVAKAALAQPVGPRFTLSVRAQGGSFAVSVDGQPCLHYDDPTPYLTGCVGLGVYQGSAARFHRLTVSPT